MKNICFFLLLFSVACTNDTTQSQVSSIELFKTYYKDLVLPERKNVEHYNSEHYIPLLDAAFQFYETKQYGDAITGISKTIKKVPLKAQALAHTVWGLCYLNMDINKEALVKFNAIDPNSDYGQQALWYKALTYLKMGNTDGARSTLSKIIGVKGHYQQAEAKEILAQL